MSLIAGNLGVVQRLLDGSGLAWGVCAGAAAHLYGNRRPIQDVDLLVTRGELTRVVGLLQSAQKAVQFDGQRIIWRGIKVFDDLTIRRGVASYPLTLDALMAGRMRRMPLLGAPVQVLPPEDVLAHKLLLNRGMEEGKHDQADAEAIARRQSLDLDYLRQRVALLNAEEALLPRLAELGLNLE